MTVTSIKGAWTEAGKIFPTDYEYSAKRRERTGYPIYYSTAAGMNAWISDLGNRLEVNLPDGKSANIWIQAPAEATITSDSAEETEDDGSATKEERRETAKRIQRLAYFYTVEYVSQMDNKKREDADVKEMQAAATEGGEIRCMVLTAENNARVAMSCITDCMAAVDILVNMEEDVDDWMIAGINAMLDKVPLMLNIIDINMSRAPKGSATDVNTLFPRFEKALQGDRDPRQPMFEPLEQSAYESHMAGLTGGDTSVAHYAINYDCDLKP